MICPGAYSDLRVIKSEGALKAIEARKAGYYSHDEMIEMVDKKLLGAERDGEVNQGEIAAGQCSSRIQDMPSVEVLLRRIIEEATAAIGKVSAMIR
jgi:NAD(P)H-dependent flavin oxidoreductase YrpB (nitropropane dioxygenase family)